MKTNKIQNITGGLVVIVALFFATMLIFQDILPFLMGWKRTVTISVLFLYAAYRFSRIYTDLFRTTPKNDENETN